MASGVKAGSAYVEVSIDDAKVKTGLRSLSATLDGWGRKATAIGMGAMMAAGAAAIPVLSSMSVFANFEAQMSKVAAITQATTEQVRELRAQAIELGKTTFFTTSQVADAQKFLGMAGFNPEQIKVATPAVLDLALAGDMDLGTAADIATNISTPFKIAAEDLSRVNDVLAKAANSSNTNVLEVGQAFKYAAPAASAAGQSLEECGAAMAILANNGLKADMAGTSIRMMLIKLADSGIQKKLRDQFNIEVTDPTGQMRPLLTILQDLKDATSDMGSTEAMGTFFDIFEARAGSAALVLGNAGNAVTEFRDKMIESGGTAAAMAKTMADNIKGDWIALTSAAEGVQIAVGDAFNDLGRDFLQWATLATRGVANWVKENQSLVSRAGLAVVALGGVGATALTAAAGLRAASVVSGLLASSKAVDFFTGLSATARLAAADYGNMGAATTKLLGVLGMQKTAHTGTAAAILLMSNAEVAARRAGSAALDAYSLSGVRAAAVENIKGAATLISTGAMKAATAVTTGAVAVVNGMTFANIRNAGSSVLAGTKNLYLALTTKGIAAGYITASAAAGTFSAAIMAIPGWGWALAGVAAIIGLATAFNKANSKAAELREEMSQKRDTGDETRRVDRLRMDRLNQLAQQQKLSNSEMAEAESLIARLSQRYGDLGMSVDKYTGKLSMAADTQDKFNLRMREAARKQIDAEIAEKRANQKELERENKYLSSGGLSRVNAVRWASGGLDADDRKLRSNAEKHRALAESIKALEARQNAIFGGDNDAASKTEAEILQEKTALFQDTGSAKQSEDAEKKLADIRRTLTRERRTQLENEISDVKELNKTYKELLETLLQTERAKLETETDESKKKEYEDKIEEWELLLRTADATERDRIERLIDKINIDSDKFGIGEKQNALADARLGLQNARYSGGAVEDWERKVDDAKYELESAQIAKAGTELKEAGEKFREAVSEYEKSKQEGDREKTAVAAVKANNARDELDRAGSRYESLSGRQTSKPLTDEEKAVMKARSGTGDALLKLAAANRSGDTAKINAAEVEVKAAKSTLQQAELDAIEKALIKAQQDSTKALEDFEKAQSGGNYEEIRRAEGRVNSTQETTKTAQSNYLAQIENMKRGAEQSSRAVMVAGTQSKHDILGGALSTGKIEGKLSEIAKHSGKTEEHAKATAENTKAMKDGLTFDS